MPVRKFAFKVFVFACYDVKKGSRHIRIAADNGNFLTFIHSKTDVLEQKFGKMVEIDEKSAAKSFGQRWLGMNIRHDLATELGEVALTSLETRALWQRFGL